jgi:(2Fe-2S) ferredoxin
MSKHSRDLTSDFQLEGRFLGFLAKDGYKIKYLRLSTPSGVYTIKLSKDLRRSLPPEIAIGVWLRVSGRQKREDTGILKLKAEYVVQTAVPNSVLPAAEAVSAKPEAPAVHLTQACILVCQKSDCCKRGGRAIMAALEAELGDRALTGAVAIKGTGCMKRCKVGPNIIMPDKTRYTQIRPADVPAILDKHFHQPPAVTVPPATVPVG